MQYASTCAKSKTQQSILVIEDTEGYGEVWNRSWRDRWIKSTTEIASRKGGHPEKGHLLQVQK